MRRRRRPVRLAASRGSWVVGAAGARPLLHVRRKPAAAVPYPSSSTVILFFFIAYLSTDLVLTFGLLIVSGDQEQEDQDQEDQDQDDQDQDQKVTMWRYAPNTKSASESHASCLAPELVPLADYCLGMPVTNTFTPAGALPVILNGTKTLPEFQLLSKPAQAVARSTLVILQDLFAAGLFLKGVDPDMFLVDPRDGRVLLSPTGWEGTSKLSEHNMNLEVDGTVRNLADLLEQCLFAQNGISVLQVEEVGLGLLPLMRMQGFQMWYCIINHVSLVPLENRRELFIRLYEQLIELVRAQCQGEYADILEELVFPYEQWHELVGPNHNSLLFLLYCGSIYDSTAATKREQAEQFTRFMRNSSAHVLQAGRAMIGRTDIALMHHSLAPLIIASLQRALQKRGWLVSTEIHSLFK